MHKIKIAVLFDSHTPTDGGSYSLIASILEGFIEFRMQLPFQITLISVGKKKSKFADLHFKPENRIIRLIIKFLILRSVRLRTIWQSKSKLSKFLLRNESNIVYYLGVPVGNTNLPFIMNVFDLQHRTHPWFPELSSESEWQGREDYYKRYLPRALAIITGTQRGKDEIQKMYGVDENNIYIIPHITSKNSKSETGVTSILRVVTYIYPAQFWSHKNHKVIVEAVKIIRNSLRAQIKVNFIGEDKGNLNYIKRIVNEYGLSDQIKFLGFVSNEIKNNLYKESRGLIYSSFSGPENLPPLEAFDIGIPVIYSDFPGAREQLGDYPFYFDPSSPMSLVNAIQQLEDEDKVQMAKRLEDQKLFVENRRPSNFLISFVKIITGVEFMVNSWDKRDSSKF